MGRILTQIIDRWQEPERHAVVDGEVSCELRGADVTLETCLACPWLLADEPDHPGGAALRCRPSAAHRALNPVGM